MNQEYYKQLNDILNNFARDLDNPRRSRKRYEEAHLRIERISDEGIRKEFSKRFDYIRALHLRYLGRSTDQIREDLLNELGGLQKLCMDENKRIRFRASYAPSNATSSGNPGGTPSGDNRPSSDPSSSSSNESQSSNDDEERDKKPKAPEEPELLDELPPRKRWRFDGEIVTETNLDYYNAWHNIFSLDLKEYENLVKELEQGIISQDVYDEYVEYMKKHYDLMIDYYGKLTDEEKKTVEKPLAFPALKIVDGNDLKVDQSLQDKVDNYNKRLEEYDKHLSELEDLAKQYDEGKIQYQTYKDKYNSVKREYDTLLEEYNNLNSLIEKGEYTTTQIENVEYSLDMSDETRQKIADYKKELYKAFKNSSSLKEVFETYQKAIEDYKKRLEEYQTKLEEFKQKGEQYKKGEISLEDYQLAVDNIMDEYQFLSSSGIRGILTKNALLEKHLKSAISIKIYEEMIRELQKSGKLSDDIVNFFQYTHITVNGKTSYEKTEEFTFQSFFEKGFGDGHTIADVIAIIEKLKLEFGKAKVKQYIAEMFDVPEPENPEKYIIKERQIEMVEDKPQIEEPEEPDLFQEKKKPREELIYSNDQNMHYRSIYEKVMNGIVGDDGLGVKSTKKYTLSNHSLKGSFALTDTDKRGGIKYALTSFPIKCVGALGQLGKKIKWGVQKQKTKDTVNLIKERVNALTDEEVEIYIDEEAQNVQDYSNNYDNKVFTMAMNDRVTRYYNEKVHNYNMQLFELLQSFQMHMDYIEILEASKEGKSEEEQKEIETSIDEYYDRAYSNMINILNTQYKGRKEINGKGLQALKQLSSAMSGNANDRGIRDAFKKTDTQEQLAHDAELERIFTDKTKTSRDRVKAYYELQNGLKVNDKEKRRIKSLGSKVAAGNRRYNPFIEIPYYGQDPLRNQIMMNVMIITMAFNVANTIGQIAQSMEQAAQIAEHNALIDAQNGLIMEGRSVAESVAAREAEFAATAKGEAIIDNASALVFGEHGAADRFGHNGWSKERLSIEQAVHDGTKVVADNIIQTPKSALAPLSSLSTQVFSNLQTVITEFAKDAAAYDGLDRWAYDALFQVQELMKAGDFVPAMKQMTDLYIIITEKLNYKELMMMSMLDAGNNVAMIALNGAVATGAIALGAREFGRSASTKDLSNYDENQELLKKLKETLKYQEIPSEEPKNEFANKTADELEADLDYWIEQQVLAEDIEKSRQISAKIKAIREAMKQAPVISDEKTSGGPKK